MKALAIGLLAAGYTALTFGTTWAAVKMEGGDPAAGIAVAGMFLLVAGVVAYEAQRDS